MGVAQMCTKMQRIVFLTFSGFYENRFDFLKIGFLGKNPKISGLRNWSVLKLGLNGRSEEGTSGGTGSQKGRFFRF